MFTVKRVEMINKTFRLPAELVERLSFVAQEKGVSMNNLVAQCCEYALGQMAEETAEAASPKKAKTKDA